MIRKRGGSLEIVVYAGRDPATRKSRKVSRTVKGNDREAQLKARQVELDLIAEARAGRVVKGARTFGDLMDRWLEQARIEESTRYNARLQLDRHVRPALGSVRLSKLKAEDLDALYRSLERGSKGKKKLAPASVRRLHATVRSVLALAVRWRWLSHNPAEGAEPPAQTRSEPQAPSTAVVVAFLASLAGPEDAEPELAMFVRLDAVTGMRRAEVCALRRSDVDLDAGVVRKVRSLGMGKGSPYLKGTKTGVRHALALDEETVHLLRLHLKAQDDVAAHNGCTIGDGYLFSLEVDCSRPMRPDYVSKRVRARRTGIPGAEYLTLRSLRHWMVTEGLSSASAKAVAGRAGHARTSTTTDVYAAWLPATDVTLANALGAALATERERVHDPSDGDGNLT